MSEIKKKIYPSSSGFMEGKNVYTDYDSGCLRSIGYRALGVHVPFDGKTAQVGASVEEEFEKELQKEQVVYERERPITVDLGDSTHLSGRVDFCTETRLIELKSTRSTSKRTKLRAGVPTTENVAQIVAYQVALERPSAELRYTFINEKKNTKEYYNFAVSIAADGSITLNNEPYRYDVYSYLSHRAHVKLLFSELSRGNSNALFAAGRPYNSDSKFSSPCTYCPFKIACDKLDNRGPTELKTSLSDAIMSVNIIKGAK